MKRMEIYVCLTSFQLMVAKGISKSSGVENIFILKYINGIEYKKIDEKTIVIHRNILGKIKTAILALLPLLSLKDATVYYFNDREPIAKNIAKYARKRVLVEEGIGTYASLGEVKVIGSTIVPDLAYVQFPELYRKSHEEYGELRAIDFNSLFNRSEIRELYEERMLTTSVDILFLGQAIGEGDPLRSYEIELLNTVLGASCGRSVAIKPHPRDECSGLYRTVDSIDVLNSRESAYPVELLISGLKPKIVITIFSSSGITLSNIDKDLLIVYCLNICRVTTGEIYDFVKYITDNSENIVMPNNELELENVIKDRLAG